MTEQDNGLIQNQIEKMESLIQEGRRPVISWGWIFTFCGVFHLVVLLWTVLRHFSFNLPWRFLICQTGIMMTGYGLAYEWAYRKLNKVTLYDRAISGIWGAFGISVGILWVFSQEFFSDPSLGMALFFILLGFAHFASSRVMQIRLQLLNGILFWLSAEMVLSEPKYVFHIFVGAAFLGEVLFGIYLTRVEKKGGTVRESSRA